MSRDIDRKVAEALGWIGIRQELEAGALWGVRPSDGVLIPIYRYSTDIAAAIGALEEFCGFRYSYTISSWAAVNGKRSTICVIYRGLSPDSQNAVGDGGGLVLSEVICAAILAARPPQGTAHKAGEGE